MKIVIAGNYGAKNIGDEMILSGLLESVRAAAPLAKIAVLSANPQETETMHNVNAEPQFPSGFRSILKSIKRGTPAEKCLKSSDYFILGGGGLFGGPEFRANYIWANQVGQAFRHKKKVIHYGQSVGEIKAKTLRGIVREIFQRSHLIAVRDHLSKENLQKIGVTKEIHVVPDLAFRTSYQPEFDRRNRAVVALRNMKKLPRSFEREVAEFLNWLHKTEGLTFDFINFQEGAKGDHELHSEVQKKLPPHSFSTLTNPNIRSVNEKFSQSQLALCMRLHSAITSIKTETPFIPISYHQKVSGLLNSLQLADNVVPLKAVTAESLQSSYKKVKKPSNKNLQEEIITFEQNILSKALQTT